MCKFRFRLVFQKHASTLCRNKNCNSLEKRIMLKLLILTLVIQECAGYGVVTNLTELQKVAPFSPAEFPSGVQGCSFTEKCSSGYTCVEHVCNCPTCLPVCRTVTQETTGYIITPEFKDMNDTDVTCSWTIKGRRDTFITLSVSTLDNCSGDMQIFENNVEEYMGYKWLCTNRMLTPTIYSVWNSVTLTLRQRLFPKFNATFFVYPYNITLSKTTGAIDVVFGQHFYWFRYNFFWWIKGHPKGTLILRTNADTQSHFCLRSHDRQNYRIDLNLDERISICQEENISVNNSVRVFTSYYFYWREYYYYKYNYTLPLHLKLDIYNAGPACNTSLDCDGNSSCIDGFCDCLDSQLFDEINNVCRTKLNYGDACNSSYECLGPHLQCLASQGGQYTCLCPDYMFYMGNSCTPATDALESKPQVLLVTSDTLHLFWTPVDNATYTVRLLSLGQKHHEGSQDVGHIPVLKNLFPDTVYAVSVVVKFKPDEVDWVKKVSTEFIIRTGEDDATRHSSDVTIWRTVFTTLLLLTIIGLVTMLIILLKHR
ncbi:uncharacterized protein LOC131942900 [Physella acuta]|uniref:uncharacterized protein LOC131942900 n=1 Tax=Physella acuta TaxID=109671 RepID=UPI0027DB15CB|nr:uncharacterized protein LOC131942900 [Physella acuta]